MVTGGVLVNNRGGKGRGYIFLVSSWGIYLEEPVTWGPFWFVDGEGGLLGK